MFREKQRAINITKNDLIKFESEVASNFENGKIRGAVHLSNNNEDELINIFQYINKTAFFTVLHCRTGNNSH